jgi:hypothetical protein
MNFWTMYSKLPKLVTGQIQTVCMAKSKLQGDAVFIRGTDTLSRNDITYDCLAQALVESFMEQLSP